MRGSIMSPPSRALSSSHEVCGHRGHHIGVVVGAPADDGQRFGIGQAVRDKEVRRRFAAGQRVAAAGEHARDVVVGRADPQGCVPALAQPVGQADVVGVHVRHDHAQDRQALELVREDLLPLRARGLVRDAAVHHRPALHAVDAVAQQPEVDVVEREGQCHAKPAHARRHLEGPARGRQRVAEGVVEFAFEQVHVGLTLT
jgi:hypothetical protein